MTEATRPPKPTLITVWLLTADLLTPGLVGEFPNFAAYPTPPGAG